MIAHQNSERLTSSHTDVTEEKQLRCKNGCCLTDQTLDFVPTKGEYLDRLSNYRNAIVDETDRIRRRATSTDKNVVNIVHHTPIKGERNLTEASMRERLRIKIPGTGVILPF